MKHVDFSQIIVFLIGMLLPLPILAYRGLQWGIILLIIYLLFVTIKYGKLIVNKTFLYLWILSIVTTIFCWLGVLPVGWKQRGIVQFFVFSICVWFSFEVDFGIKGNNIIAFVDGIKIACILQVCWGYLQFILHYINIDINQLIFVDILNLNQAAFKATDEIFHVCGFGWHPAQLVPVIVLTYCLFDSLIIKVFLLGLAAISHNSTCLFAILVCCFLDVIYRLRDAQLVKRKKDIFKVMVALLFAGIIIVVNANGVIDILQSTVANLWERISMVLANKITDTSTNWHVRYYTYYFDVIKEHGIFSFLFGLGYECSGYPYMVMLRQYVGSSGWVTESDVINFMVGRGVVWTFVFYMWIINLIRKGKRISVKFLFFFFALMTCGILYNNQFDWIIIIEIVLGYAIKENINIWDISNNNMIRRN